MAATLNPPSTSRAPGRERFAGAGGGAAALATALQHADPDEALDQPAPVAAAPATPQLYLAHPDQLDATPPEATPGDTASETWRPQGGAESSPRRPSTAVVVVSGQPTTTSARSNSRPFRPEPSDLLDTAHPAQQRRQQRPTTGVRRLVWDASGGRINLGRSAAEQRESELRDRIARPLHRQGAGRVAVASIKGGVGKTTVSACLGLTLAEGRDDRVAAVDINLHAGTLHDRLVGRERPDYTIQHLLDDLADFGSIPHIDSYSAAAGRRPARLAVFAGENDPNAGAAFADDDYNELISALTPAYQVLIADCGTGLNDSATRATLDHTDALVVVTTPSIDAASRAGYTLEWLADSGYGELVSSAIVVFSHDHPSSEIDTDALHSHLQGRCEQVIDIPADDHLRAGARIDLDAVAPRAREAYQRLAALVIDRL